MEDHGILKDGKTMKFLQFLLLSICIIFTTSGCSPSVSGTVVDAETGKPLEGAVVLVEWTSQRGLPGLYHTESDRVVEKVTDKDGKFTIPGAIGTPAEPPDVSVYKKGYVTWNSKYIFPAWQNRDDFRWQTGTIYKLDRFKDTYSYTDHYGFTTSSIHSTIGKPTDKQLFLRTYSDSEEAQRIRERNQKDRQRERGIKQ